MLARFRLIRRLPAFTQQTRLNHSHALTPIQNLITGSIRATGPISFSTYMSFCLAHPIHGYYMNPNNPVFGTRGDFITSPEISQVFGELVAIWFLSTWQQRSQNDIRLVELGPGRGTLTEDITRVISRLGPSRLKSIHLVESSQALRQVQHNKLAPIAERNGWELAWHDTIEDIPKTPDLYTMLVAHEFFDALPIHVFEKTEEGWKEVLISHRAELLPSSENDPSSSAGPDFCRVVPSGPVRTSEYLVKTSPRFADLPTGSKLEISPSGFRVARKIAELLQVKGDSSPEAGGSALFIDYGDDRAFGDSIRAFKDHKEVDIFHRPGDCDITANVDFAYLREACSDLVIPHGPITQQDFLMQMGLPLRVSALVRNAASQDRKEAIQTAAERLINPLGMGREYKFLGLTSRKGHVWPFVPREQEPEQAPS